MTITEYVFLRQIMSATSYLKPFPCVQGNGYKCKPLNHDEFIQ